MIYRKKFIKISLVFRVTAYNHQNDGFYVALMGINQYFKYFFFNKWNFVDLNFRSQKIISFYHLKLSSYYYSKWNNRIWIKIFVLKLIILLLFGNLVFTIPWIGSSLSSTFGSSFGFKFSNGLLVSAGGAGSGVLGLSNGSLAVGF